MLDRYSVECSHGPHTNNIKDHSSATADDRRAFQCLRDAEPMDWYASMFYLLRLWSCCCCFCCCCCCCRWVAPSFRSRYDRTCNCSLQSRSIIDQLRLQDEQQSRHRQLPSPWQWRVTTSDWVTVWEAVHGIVGYGKGELVLWHGSCLMAPCRLRGCKNRVHSVSWPEVVKAIPNQGLDCFVS